MIDRSLHPNSRAMLNAWRRLAYPDHPGGDDGAGLPAPADLLSHLFVLRRADDGGWVFRNAGQRLSAVTGRVLHDRDFTDLWREGDRSRVSALLASVIHEGEPGIIHGRAQTLDRRTVGLEVSLAPLVRPNGDPRPDRMLGLYQILGSPKALGSQSLWIHAVEAIMPAARLVQRQGLRLVVSNA